MANELTWEEWFKEYPCPVALKLPELAYDDYDNRYDAERHIDNDGMNGDSSCVVEFNNRYYVVSPDYAKELTGKPDLY